MKDILTQDFQDVVDDMLIRNRSLLDTLTKFQDSSVRVNRAIVKAVTHCGCIQIDAKKQEFSLDRDLDEIRAMMDTHVHGQLCPACRDIVEQEVGVHMFYLASICNALDLSLYDTILKEQQRLNTLGKFNMR